MRKLFLLLPILLLASCFQAEQNCKDFKTGKFQFDYKIGGVVKTTIFERNDSLEVETFEGRTDTSEIRWVNDCEYILKKKHPKNREEEKAIDMKILTTSKNSYTFEFGNVGSAKTQTGTVTKIN